MVSLVAVTVEHWAWLMAGSLAALTVSQSEHYLGGNLVQLKAALMVHTKAAHSVDHLAAVKESRTAEKTAETKVA